MTLPPRLWDGVVRRIATTLPPFVVRAWIEPLEVREAGDGIALLCPSRFHRDRVRRLYLDAIREALAAEAGRPLPVGLVHEPGDSRRANETSDSVGVGHGHRPLPSAPPAEGRGGDPEAGPPARPAERAATGTPPRREAARRVPTVSPRQFSFENFVVGRCNALAREASVAVAEGRQSAVSLLCLTADAGLGKTHLARALAAEAGGRGARIRYTSSEAFTNELLDAIRSRRTAGFKRRYREDCDILVVEDLQFLRGKTSTQLELFHTVQHLLDAGGRVVVTADRLPVRIPDLDPRLRSTLSSGLVAEIEPPDASVRRRILRARAAAGGVRLPEPCLDRLVEAVRGSVRDLEGALIQVVATASLLKRPIDLELVESALRKVAPEPEPDLLEPEEVAAVVATFFKTSREALASRSRRRDAVVPRQLAMYLCRRYTDASLSRIGRAFGRDHPAVAHAIRVVERRMLERAPLRYQVEALAARLDEVVRDRGGARGAGRRLAVAAPRADQE